MRADNLYLGNLKPGEKAYVVSYDGDSSDFIRYSEIGIYKGSSVEVVRNDGPLMIVKVGYSSRIALRGEVSRLMRVSFDKV